jgi:multiple sugar transport system substrate-binding protein
MNLLRRLSLSIAGGSIALILAASAPAIAGETLSMWVRDSAATAAPNLVDLWNASHDDKVKLVVVPAREMVGKITAAVAAGNAADLVSLDLIYLPDLMRAGLVTDLTDSLKDDPNQAKMAQAYKDLATYKGRLYGTGFIPDVSVLVWNKDLFKQAGLDPEKPPTTLGEIHADAKKIRALGGDTYGFYFSGACAGCNIFVLSPYMVASGAKLLPASADEDALQGPGVKEVLQAYRDMWTEGLVPASAQTDNGSNFVSLFEAGKIGIEGAGGFLIADIKKAVPNLNFGVAFLPGITEGQKSAFVGGDVVIIPKNTKHADIALQFIKWQLTDAAQLEGLAKNNLLPTRTDLADNKYFKADPRIVTIAKAIGIGFVPWVYHFEDMVEAKGSPWGNLLQSAIFDGKIDDAIASAQRVMKQIAGR